MSVIAIATIIISAAELLSKAQDVTSFKLSLQTLAHYPYPQLAKKLIPTPPTELEKKHRWIQCTIKNETQFSILLQKSYFDSGRYWDAPGSIKPFEQMTFSVCNDDNSVLTGVSGGTAFSITLDNKTAYNFALGWTSPELGGFKAGVVESTDPKDGYNDADESGSSINSRSQYAGKDADKKPVRLQFHISSAPGQKALYVVNEVLVNENLVAQVLKQNQGLFL